MTKSWKLWAGVSSAVLLMGACALVLASWTRARQQPAPLGRLLACHELVEAQQMKLLAELIQAAGDVPTVLLSARSSEELALRNALPSYEIDVAKLRFLQVPHESSRVGQYGPFWVERPRDRPVLIDAPRHPVENRGGQQVAYDLAESFDLRVVRLAMYLSGGNLISNGQGIALTTTGILDQNADLRRDEATIRRLLREALGIEQLIILATLEGEPSGHVEWFAAFTAADTVVVGQCDPKQDLANAAALDASAKRLEEVEVRPGKKLKVERVPMPPRRSGIWQSYTPVVFLGGNLLVPVYPGRHTELQKQALATYGRLAPKVVPIDVRPLEQFGVTLRSLVLRLGSPVSGGGQ
jgi:agmatine/peptidylarginine deiminase